MVVFRGRQEPLGQRFWKFENRIFDCFKFSKKFKKFQSWQKNQLLSEFKKNSRFSKVSNFSKKNWNYQTFQKSTLFQIFWTTIFFYLNNSVVFNIKKSIKFDHNFLWNKSTRMLSFSIGTMPCITLLLHYNYKKSPTLFTRF